jgi:hypothetical protein
MQRPLRIAIPSPCLAQSRTTTAVDEETGFAAFDQQASVEPATGAERIA